MSHELKNAKPKTSLMPKLHMINKGEVMNSSISKFYIYTTIFIVLIGSTTLNADSISSKTNIFSEGSQWVLNYNGKPMPMHLLKQTMHSAKETRYDLSISTLRGELWIHERPKSGIQNVALLLFEKNGSRVTCSGSIVKGSNNNIIAGNCDPHLGLGAFYAERVGTNFFQKKYKYCTSKLKRAQDAYKNTLQELWNEKNTCNRERGDNAVLQSNSAFPNYPNITGSNPKAENTMKNVFPSRPKIKTRENKWLKAHNAELYDVVMKVLDEKDRRNFSSWEKNRCRNGNLYCKATARQKIIACSQDVGC